ncbi:MAG: hypothetical protein GTO18_04925 [Anaerolineales bacterium]|nr:hypothetical protein [Anaerolineales bacterium]
MSMNKVREFKASKYLKKVKLGQKHTERGQTVILLALVMVILIGFAILAIDGGRLFTERRDAQNATDASALAAALARCDKKDIVASALARAASNGYNNDGTTNTVSVNFPPLSGPYAGDSEYIEVIIVSRIEGTIGNLIYSGPLEVTTRAVSYCWVSRTGMGAALFAGSETCENTIDWSGSDTSIVGGVHTNRDLHVGGSTNYIKGDVTYVTTVDAPEDKITYDPPENPIKYKVMDYPVDFEMEDFEPGGEIAAAVAGEGKYYNCECKIDMNWLESQGYYDDATGKIQEGLYYTTDNIDISANNIIGEAVTFVSRGSISFSGSSHYLYPYVEGLLAFTDMQKPGGAKCSVQSIKLSGSSHNWYGVMFSPNGLIEMAGATNTTIHGSLIGYTLALNGSMIQVNWDPNFLPPPPPKVNLSE